MFRYFEQKFSFGDAKYHKSSLFKQYPTVKIHGTFQ